MSSFCFETLFSLMFIISTQFIVIICCRGFCRGCGNIGFSFRFGWREDWGGLLRDVAGGISSVMGKFSILPYFFLRLFRGFLGIREQRRRGEGERERARGDDGRGGSLPSSERLSALYFRQMHLVQSHRCSTDYLRLSPPSTESPPVPPFLSRVINSIEHLE